MESPTHLSEPTLSRPLGSTRLLSPSRCPDSGWDAFTEAELQRPQAMLPWLLPLPVQEPGWSWGRGTSSKLKVFPVLHADSQLVIFAPCGSGRENQSMANSASSAALRDLKAGKGQGAHVRDTCFPLPQ